MPFCKFNGVEHWIVSQYSGVSINAVDSTISTIEEDRSAAGPPG